MVVSDASIHSGAGADEVASFVDTLQCNTLITLQHGKRWALIAPDTGGSVAAFFDIAPNGSLHHWLRPANAQALAANDPLGMASFPLMPYCNRLRDARFSFDGKIVDLSDDGNTFLHALHGHAWRRPWTRACGNGNGNVSHIDTGDANTATLVFTHEPGMTGGKYWPYPYQASQTFTLDAAGLHVTLQARNSGSRAMPFGMGHHPYYPRTPGMTIKANVRAMWAATPDLLPTGLMRHPAVAALSDEGGMIADDFDLDNNFAGWGHAARIVWPNTGRALRLEASSPFDHLVIYSPMSQPDLLCVEPVSNTADFLNLDLNLEQRVDDVGGTVLAPGEILTGRFSWIPQ